MKLILNRETLVALTPEKAAFIAGGETSPTLYQSCWTELPSCGARCKSAGNSCNGPACWEVLVQD